MTKLDIIDNAHNDMMTLLRRIYELAVADFTDGCRRDGRYTGRQIMEKCGVEHYRDSQVTLASTVYRKTIQAFIHAE